MDKNLNSLFMIWKETWLKPDLDFKVPGYSRRGGCATLIKDGIAYRKNPMSKDLECVTIEIFN